MSYKDRENLFLPSFFFYLLLLSHFDPFHEGSLGFTLLSLTLSMDVPDRT